MAAENKKVDRRREDYMTNRILAVFTFAFLLILGLMAAYRTYASVDTMFITQKVLYVLAAVFAVIMIAGVVWEFAGKKREYKVICGKNIAVAAAIVAICAFVGATFTSSGIQMMYVFVPIVSALILIYLLYPHDFFLISVICAVGAVVLWYLSRSILDGFVWARYFRFNKGVMSFIAALAVVVAYAGVVKFLESKRGVLKLGNKSHEALPKDTKYLLSYITAAVTAVCLVLGFICGATVAYYLVFVMVAYLLILAVYYTVKML